MSLAQHFGNVLDMGFTHNGAQGNSELKCTMELIFVIITISYADGLVFT